MIVSTKGRYALRLLVDLAEHLSDGYVPLKVLAERQQISVKYAESIMTLLSKGGLIAAERGATGGYRLTTSPDEITVGQVLATAEGAIHAVACLEENAAPCPRVEQCKTVGLWRKLDELVDGYLAKVTLAQLVEGNVPQA